MHNIKDKMIHYCPSCGAQTGANWKRCIVCGRPRPISLQVVAAKAMFHISMGMSVTIVAAVFGWKMAVFYAVALAVFFAMKYGDA